LSDSTTKPNTCELYKVVFEILDAPKDTEPFAAEFEVCFKGGFDV
jgi:hypothetical protein